jgi:gluconokinase
VVILLMGVSGSGKTTVGKQLAESLGWRFYEGDQFHSPENIAKMSAGIPLTDEDRLPWLNTIHNLIQTQLQNGQPAVIACSALKKSYRELLLKGNPGLRIVYLKGDEELIRQRMEKRGSHFMKAAMLSSQFRSLEEPEGVLTVDISQDPSKIVNTIERELHTWEG